LGRAGFEPAKA